MKPTKFLILTMDVDHDGATDEQRERILNYDDRIMFVTCVHPKFKDNTIEIGENEYVRDIKGNLYYFCDVLTREDVINGFERNFEIITTLPKVNTQSGLIRNMKDDEYHRDPQLNAVLVLRSTRSSKEDLAEIDAFIRTRMKDLGLTELIFQQADE